jgi:L-idonate 5-dehydrogenase
MYSYCENMRHLGSAATLPHTAGLFADKVLLHQSQLYAANSLKPETGAFAEPLAVAYNGVRRLGDLIGKDVLVMGGGPIGCLCAAAAKVLGASSVTVVDVCRPPLDMALAMGADDVCNSKAEPERVAAWKEHKGSFDLMIEASGNRFALTDGMSMTRPEGIVSQVGMYGTNGAPTDIGPFLTKGLQWRGVFRFYDEFPAAARALVDGLINPLPLLSASFPAKDCVEAMRAALSPDTSKVQLALS